MIVAIIRGTPGNDLLYGTRFDDDIFAFAGNDTVRAGSGDDYVEGADGNDLLQGEAGSDWLVGGRGIDAYFGGTGFDAADFSFDATGSTGGITLDVTGTASWCSQSAGSSRGPWLGSAVVVGWSGTTSATPARRRPSCAWP